MTVLDRVWVGRKHECWRPWPKYPRRGDYKSFKGKPAHRAVYLQFYGVEADTVDHLCENKWCLNPHHLESVTRGENVARWIWRHRDEQSCPSGHEWTTDNLYLTPAGHRRCRTCRRDGMRTPGASPRSNTECRRGHPWSTENSYWKSDGRRRCRECQKLRQNA